MLRVVRDLVPSDAELGAKSLRPADLRARLSSVAAKRSSARIIASATSSLKPWPASSTITSSARGHARCSIHAFAIGAWKSKRPFTSTQGMCARAAAPASRAPSSSRPYDRA